MIPFGFYLRLWSKRWKCPGCGYVMKKENAYYFDAHAPDCGWASMIPLSGRSGYRDGKTK